MWKIQESMNLHRIEERGEIEYQNQPKSMINRYRSEQKKQKKKQNRREEKRNQLREIHICQKE
jgi:hypothetical protein